MRGSILIDNRVEAAAINDARRDQKTPIVQLTYPRKGVWSGQNQLGVELPFQLDAQRMQTIFKMDEWGFPEVWTISLSVAVPTLETGQVFDLVGEVSFGSGGIVQTFEVDWVDGTIFSLPMNAINVRARWSTLATFFGIVPPENARVSVIASRGGIRHARATKTDFFFEDVAAGAYQGPSFGPIPAFAKSVMVVPSQFGTAAVLYAATTELHFFANSTNPPAANYDVLNVPGTRLGPTTSFKVPVPANARYWTFRNTAGAPAAIGGALIWNLFDE